MEIDIEFIKDNDRFALFGVTKIGDSQFSRCEHIFGYIDIRQTKIGSRIPIDVRIVCCWEPFYLFFNDMADAILTSFKQKQIKNALFELLDFKNFIETQAFKDIYQEKNLKRLSHVHYYNPDCTVEVIGKYL